MNFLLSNRLFDRYLCHGTADQRSRQVIVLTLKSPLMPCAAIAIAITERGFFLSQFICLDCELTLTVEHVTAN